MASRILSRLTIVAVLAASIATAAVAGTIEVTRGATIPLAAAPKVSARATLIVRGVRAAPNEVPLYQVSLKDAQGNVAPVAIINFFNASAPNAPNAVSRSFDTAPALGALRGPPVAVIIEPISGVSGVAPQIAPDSRVSIESVEIVWQ